MVRNIQLITNSKFLLLILVSCFLSCKRGNIFTTHEQQELEIIVKNFENAIAAKYGKQDSLIYRYNYLLSHPRGEDNFFEDFLLPVDSIRFIVEKMQKMNIYNEIWKGVYAYTPYRKDSTIALEYNMSGKYADFLRKNAKHYQIFHTVDSVLNDHSMGEGLITPTLVYKFRLYYMENAMQTKEEELLVVIHYLALNVDHYQFTGTVTIKP